jgi:hypothetical protein
MQIMVVVEGALKAAGEGKILADGTVRIKTSKGWMPVISRQKCQALGLDPVAVQKTEAPAEALCKMGDNGHDVLLLERSEWDVMQRELAAKACAAREATLEAAIPGAVLALELSAKAYNESARYHDQRNRMMDDETNDGARMPRPINGSFAAQLAEHLANYPRAALYLRAKAQEESTSWADNTGKGAAAKKAIEILIAGGTIETATAALAERREWAD